MNNNDQIRKLTAILSADVAGYSRLMEKDEAKTVKLLTDYREEFARIIDAHGGRIVDTPGDAILAEFPSIIEALKSAVKIQKTLKTANMNLSLENRMHFRIGVNLGDVIQKGNSIYGNGVNLSARVEALAEAGGICITGPVYDQVKQKLGLEFRSMGEHQVKNISEPIRVYRVGLNLSDAETGPPAETAANVSSRQPVCIAVLPFENFHGTREHDYFALGFVEDVISDLSHFNNMQVISSYTTRKMDSGSTDLLGVAGQMGIDYLLKGNLRRRGRQIRISPQLINTATAGIMWAEHYDAPLDEKLFEIQDDIVQRVVGAISSKIDKNILSAARNKPLTSLAVYDWWLRGMEHLRKGTPAADGEARQMFQQALDLDPNYSRAYAGLSLSYFNDWSCQLWDQWEETEAKAYTYAKKAYELDDTDHVVQMILGRILLFRRRFDQAEQHLDNALALNANDADNLVQIAFSKALLGNAQEGELLYLKGLTLNPFRENWYYIYGAFTYFMQHGYNRFLETAHKAPLTEVWIDQPAYFAAAYAHMGNMEKASHYLDLLVKTFKDKIFSGRSPQPDEILDWLKMANPFKYETDLEHLTQGLILAGLQQPASKQYRFDDRTPEASTIEILNIFQKKDGLRQITFEGASIRIPEVKGFHDLERLLTAPENEIHCTELFGSPVRTGQMYKMIDEKARHSYENRIRDLQEEIGDAEQMNDLVRTENLKTEMDHLIEHLSKAMGLGGKARELNSDVERTRSAVTWRIRSAISKISKLHPELGKHLTNAIQTGAFCSYSPEKSMKWQV